MTAPDPHHHAPTGGKRRLILPMTARDPQEPHRVSTTLELLFDLCFVVAIASAAAHLHHGIAAGHAAHALGSFVLVFFSVWWAWMNYTWFASAYDRDDVPYRLKTLGQIAGALVVAAGVPRAFEHQDFTLVTVGYGIMRVMMVAQWLRAAAGDPSHRATCRRYALGIALCQLGWIAALTLPPGWWVAAWFVLAPAELLVPVWAERLGMTTWHPHHIGERYGLMTIIVLGESVLSATVAVQGAMDAGHPSLDLILLAAGSLVLLFAMWWCYFELPTHGPQRAGWAPFVWGYGHLLIFAAAAAAGAGIAVQVDLLGGHGAVPAWHGGVAVGTAASLYLLGVWWVVIRGQHFGWTITGACWLAILGMPALGLSPHAVPLIAVALAAVVVVLVCRPAAD